MKNCVGSSSKYCFSSLFCDTAILTAAVAVGLAERVRLVKKVELPAELLAAKLG